MRTGSAPALGFVGASIVLALAAGSLGTTGAVAQQAAPETARTAAPDTLAGLPAGAVITDGDILGLARDGDRLFVQGSFKQIGRYAGPGDRLGSTGRSEPIPEIADGQVSVVVSDGAGGWYLGGDFTRIGGRAAGGLAHVRADGSLDPAFLPDADGLVSAFALQGSTLYVGGDFRHVGGTSRKRVAAVSTTDGSVLPFEAPQASWVTELAASPTAVYVGTDRVTAVDPVTGAAIGGFHASVKGDVHALTLGGGLLYVGTDTLVALDPATGARVRSFAPAGGAQKGRSYHSLLRAGPVLYVGSDRTTRLQALDGTTGAAVRGFAPVLGGRTGTFATPRGVYDLALDGDRLWVGGSFTSAGGRAAHGLAILDATSGAREDTGLPAYNRQVNAVELSGGDAFVGGTFFMTDWVRSNGIAALDAETLDPDPGFRNSRRVLRGPAAHPGRALRHRDARDRLRQGAAGVLGLHLTDPRLRPADRPPAPPAVPTGPQRQRGHHDRQQALRRPAARERRALPAQPGRRLQPDGPPGRVVPGPAARLRHGTHQHPRRPGRRRQLQADLEQRRPPQHRHDPDRRPQRPPAPGLRPQDPRAGVRRRRARRLALRLGHLQAGLPERARRSPRPGEALGDLGPRRRLPAGRLPGARGPRSG